MGEDLRYQLPTCAKLFEFTVNKQDDETARSGHAAAKPMSSFFFFSPKPYGYTIRRHT